MAAVERVFALHDFDAENPDEVSFKAGEAVIVVEKDDAYGDGWWQGTNLKGETGLFPFSYTTYDQEAAKGSAAAQRSGEDAAAGSGPNGKVMNTTMADIDEALAGLRTGNGGSGAIGAGKVIPSDRRSMNSERTGDFSVGDTDENGGDAEDDLEARAKARAALAVNAARNQEEVDEIERAEQARMKAQAQRIFEEEEEKQRRLLLKKEEERKVAAAQGTLKESEKIKVAPIAGLDMSDDSDSEGSEGPDYDDGMAAPTHAPLFGGMATSPPNRSSFNNSQNFRGEAPGSDGTPKDPTLGVFERQQQHGSGRNLSPIPSSIGGESPNQYSINQTTVSGGGVAAASGVAAGTYAASKSAAANQKSAGVTSTDDQRSLSSSKGRGSIAADSPAPASSAAFTSPAANGTSAGTASTSMVGTETPKSQFTAAQQQSPGSSVAGSRQQHHSSPGGDPRDWTVDQVVEWGRSKGWDEAQVVSKFAEHEISGDVLLEMDINILKEIDIQAFGKRFQVSTAIKELNKSLHGPTTATLATPVEPASATWPATPDGGAGITSATPPPPAAFTPQHPHQIAQQQQQQPPVMAMQQQQHQQHQLQQQVPRDFDPQAQSPRLQQSQQFNVPGRASSNNVPGGMPGQIQSVPPSATSQYFDVPIATPNDAAWPQSPNLTGRDSQDRKINNRYNEEPLSASKAEGRRASLRTGSDEPLIVSSAPMVAGVGGRKRESAGSASGKTSTDRSSFFAGFSSQKVRKPAPRVLSQAPSETDGKGTFSRLGFSRHKQGIGSNEVGTPASDIRNKISLPTSSPTYDAFGDTARRNRASQLSSGSGGLMGNGAGANRSATGAYGAGGGASGASHQKQTSVGSAGPNAADWHTPQSPNSDQRRPGGGGAVEGPVMLRIRPVDREGWMRKKGERYNSWKPRYLALKGSDLVLLREPSAAKIKGYVSMKGYKVIADENTNPGKYGFKILHETEKPHYFSSDDAIVVREWMKALMKATIDRDTSLPVISSYNNATISLKEAQRMNPPPRPPSPTSRARAQRATARANKDQLTAKDASVLMGLHQSNDTRQKGFLVRDSPKSSFDSIQQSTKSKYKSSISSISMGTARPIAKSMQGNIGTSDLRTPLRKKVAPLRTSDLIHNDKNRYNQLPVLQNDDEESITDLGNFWDPSPITSSPVAAPTPLPKSATSTTLGCADLPAPPPPSHSPDHRRKINAFMQRLGKSKESPAVDADGVPTPFSKGTNVNSIRISENGSASTYPTLSAHSMMSPSQFPMTFLNAGDRSTDRRSKWYKDGMKRPKSAGAGSTGSPNSSRGGMARSFASTTRPLSKDQFIVFSVRKGASSNPNSASSTAMKRPSTADPSINTSEFDLKRRSPEAGAEYLSPSSFSSPNRSHLHSSPLKKIVASPHSEHKSIIYTSEDESNSRDRRKRQPFYGNRVASESSPDLRKGYRFSRRNTEQSEIKEEARVEEIESGVDRVEEHRNIHIASHNLGQVGSDYRISPEVYMVAQGVDQINYSNGSVYIEEVDGQSGVANDNNRSFNLPANFSPALPPIPASPIPPATLFKY